MPMKTILNHLQTIVKDAMELFDNIFSTTYEEMEFFFLKKKKDNVDKKTSKNFCIVDKDNEFLKPNKKKCKQITSKNFNSKNPQPKKCYNVEFKRISIS